MFAIELMSQCLKEGLVPCEQSSDGVEATIKSICGFFKKTYPNDYDESTVAIQLPEGYSLEKAVSKFQQEIYDNLVIVYKLPDHFDESILDHGSVPKEIYVILRSDNKTNGAIVRL